MKVAGYDEQNETGKEQKTVITLKVCYKHLCNINEVSCVMFGLNEVAFFNSLPLTKVIK